MHNRMKADLYSAGITSPDMLWHAIDHATQSASNAARLTPSRRVNKPLRRFVACAVLLSIAAAVAVLA